MKILKTVFVSALSVSAGFGALSAFAACDDDPQDENTFDPVGTYAFYSLKDGENTYTVGQTGIVQNVKQTFLKEDFLFTFHANGTAEYFLFGAEEMQYGTWEQGENNALHMEIGGIAMQATGNGEFLSWADNQLIYTLQKTQLPSTDAYETYCGEYFFFSLTAEGVEYSEGDTYLDLEELSRENYRYRILPDGFLHVRDGEEEYFARWAVNNNKLSFLLPYGYGAKSYAVTINTTLGELLITLENNDHETVYEYWVFQKD